MQIPTDIMVALIGLAGSAFGAFIGVLASAKLTNYRIEQLEKKVDKHNTVIERTYKLEESQAVIQEQIKVVNHRIGDLEKEREEEDMKKYELKEWARAAGVRAVKTMAQTAVAMLPAAATITAVDWKTVVGTAALAGVASILTSIKGLPELDVKTGA